MKYLSHSKKFRKNLYRWLGMYIGVMLFFTSVITYSKYMIGFVEKENARVANFNIDIHYDEDEGCKPGALETCSIGKYRPTSPISYYFTVDTKNIEVRTFFILTINVNSNFEIIELASIENNTSNEYQPINLENIKKNNKINLENTILPAKGKNTKYKITVRYNGKNILKDKNGNPYYEDIDKSMENIEKIVTIDYSAEQKTSK